MQAVLRSFDHFTRLNDEQLRDLLDLRAKVERNVVVFASRQPTADPGAGGCPVVATWTMLRNVYLLLQLVAFCTEIECVFVSTHAILRLQMAKDISSLGTARSLIQLMHAAFEFEYVAVRSSFMTGLLAFLAAQSLRARYALRECRELSLSAMWFMLASVATLLAYSETFKRSPTPRLYLPQPRPAFQRAPAQPPA